MAQQKKQAKRLISAAIDFGTTFSSWAYSHQNSFEKDHTDVIARNWNDGSHLSAKAPTTVLIRPDGKTLEAFGYDAENKYVDLIEDKKHMQYYLFKQFKMVLFDQMSISSDLKIKDSRNKTLPAMTVFSLAIEYLKNDILSTINKGFGGNVTEEDITWVLTVPAIWTDSARVFMIRAAERAGIQAENLQLALEPEVASLFCQNMRVKAQTNLQQESSEDFSKLAPGTKYMVLDAGGGTVDMTVHQVGDNGGLDEVYKASGNAWGGSKVNKCFHSVIADAVGREVYKQFKIEQYEYFLDLDRDFEVGKRNIEPDTEGKLRIKFPTILLEMYKQATGCDLVENLTSDLTLQKDKLVINHEACREFFKDAVAGITEHIAKLFAVDKVSGTNIILLVGGFSECMMLNKAISNTFKDKRCIVPSDASLAVLKGAVIFGHDDKGIMSRISKFTYGISCLTSYDPRIHPVSKLQVQSDGQIKIDNVFSVLVRAGEKIVPGESCKPKSFFPSKKDITYFGLRLYASPRADPSFVDEPDCVKIGEVVVDCQDRYGRVGGAAVSLMFGGTEIQVSAISHLTGETTKATFTTI